MLIPLVLCLSGCRDEAPEPGDQLIYYRIDLEPETLDPQIANDAGSRLVIMNIFEGLVRLDEKDEAVPGAASDWDISGDKKMYTFHLRSGLKWSDGSKLTSVDYLYGFQRTFDPKTQSPTAQTLYCIRNAEKVAAGEMEIASLGVFAPDESTVVIQLEYPEQDFLELLATPPAMPCNRKFFESTAGRYGREYDKLLTNGSFYVRKNGWEHGEYIYLRANQEYTGDAAAVPAGVNIKISEGPENVCSAISSGEIDCGAISSSEYVQAMKSGFHLTGFGDTVWGISFNTSDELLSDRAIRCGLLQSLDRNNVMKDLPDGCRVTANIIPESAELNGKSYRVQAGSLVYEREDASALISAGLSAKKLASMPNLTILCADDEKTQHYVNNIIESWNTLTGCYFNKKPVPVSQLRDMISSGEYEVAVAPLVINGSTPMHTLSLFSSSGRADRSVAVSKDYDVMLEKLRKYQGNDIVELTLSAEQYLSDNGIFYPLFVENRYYATSPDVEGIIFHPYGAEADFHGAVKTVTED